MTLHIPVSVLTATFIAIAFCLLQWKLWCSSEGHGQDIGVLFAFFISVAGAFFIAAVLFAGAYFKWWIV